MNWKDCSDRSCRWMSVADKQFSCTFYGQDVDLKTMRSCPDRIKRQMEAVTHRVAAKKRGGGK